MQDNRLVMHYSNLEVMKARTNLSASETDVPAMFLRWKKAVFVTFEIWFSKDKLLSKYNTHVFKFKFKLI